MREQKLKNIVFSLLKRTTVENSDFEKVRPVCIANHVSFAYLQKICNE